MVLPAWLGRAATLASLAAVILIRNPHGKRAFKTPVAEDRRDALETGLLALVGVLSGLVPLAWVCAGWPSSAEYPLRPVPFGLGVAVAVVGLWLFHRSHADLGANWSVTLQLREEHRLVTSGVYARVRHPMYTSLFLISIGQALFLPNWVAGPAYLVGFGILYALRVGREERMMLDRFGAEYEAYRRRTGRLLPRFYRAPL